MKKIIPIILLLACIIPSYGQKWHQFGIKIGTNFTIQREYTTDGVNLDGLINPDAYLFFRGGKFIYGEIGVGYDYFKGSFSKKAPDGLSYLYKDETILIHSIMVPVKLVGYIPLGNVCAIELYAGVIYQPIIKVSDNNLDFSKKTLSQNTTYLNTGLDLKFGPILIGASYKYGFQTFFNNQPGKKPQFVNVSVGFEF